MKRFVGIAAVFFLFVADLQAAETIAFKEAQPKKSSKTITEPITEPLTKHERLVVKLPRGFLVLNFTDLKSIEKDRVLAESCRIHWLLLEKDQVSAGTEESKIEYDVRDGDGSSRVLERKSGSQEFSKNGVEISWSYSTVDSIHIYFQPGCRYAIVKGKLLGSTKTASPHR